MDWLKEILEKATISDGALDVDGLMKAIQTEVPKHFVSKADYNTKAGELKAASETIETLKKENQGNETLQKTIKEHETTIGNLQKENESMKKTYSLKAVLKEAGCSDPDYLIFKHGGIEKFTFDKEGKPVDAKQVAESYKESLPHVFPTGQKQQTYHPVGGTSNGGVSNPFSKETWNLTEQGKMYRDNPVQAKEMAEAAGVTI